MTVRTRFAPSPTGFMHVGNVRTALYAWLFARKHGGQFILRIEDTDKNREVEGSIGHIMECLKWLGIDWDESIDKGGPYEPYLQSARIESHHRYARELIAKGYAYPDPYTQEELEAFRKKAEDEKRPFLFREHRPDSIMEWNGKTPLRFRVPEVKRYTWNDLVRGELTAGEEALDDFILIKGDGYPTYNFAHIIDDYEMKVTHIMRGQEFISSTPKFLSLYDALGFERPEIATMPPIMGEGGNKKLGKRDGAKDLLEYRAEGYLPEAMVNFLALLGWNPGTDDEIYSAEELIALFDLSRVQRSGAQFNEEKLLHINQEWMRKLPEADFIRMGSFEAPDTERLTRLVPELKERATTLGEARDLVAGELSYIFTVPELSAELLTAKEVVPGSTKAHLEHIAARLMDMPEGTGVEGIKAHLMPYADALTKEEGGRGAVLWPLRYALSGKERSPDPFSLIYILGLHEAASRVQRALGILGQ